MKRSYSEFLLANSTVPIFCRDWWLDIVCESGDWNVAVVQKGGVIVATMPYYIKRQYGLTLLSHPPLTQVLGPWLRPSSAKYAKALGEQ